MKLTININPEDILAITHADDGRAVISMSIGNTVEMHLTVEEQADDVIEMLMAKDDKIEVGDEVYCKDDDVSDSGVVTWVGKDSIYAMWQDGSAGEVQKDECIKTGRHFDIAKILEEMRND